VTGSDHDGAFIIALFNSPSPLARFIVSVGGCCLASVLMPVVWLRDV
jgi:hypothetical protein